MKELSHQEAERIFDEAGVAHIGVISRGQPYVTPISFVRDGDVLWMRCGPGRRADALVENDRVCVEVAITDASVAEEWQSAIAFGTASVVQDPGEVAHAVGLLLEKYRDPDTPPISWATPDLPPGSAVVLRVEVDEMSARSSGGGHEPEARPGRI